KNLGLGGRDLKNLAQAYIDDAKNNNAPLLEMKARLDAVEARHQVLEQDLVLLQQRKAAAETQFDSMTDAELRDYIKTHTGVAPVGQPAHKNLVRMAVDAQPRPRRD